MTKNPKLNFSSSPLPIIHSCYLGDAGPAHCVKLDQIIAGIKFDYSCLTTKDTPSLIEAKLPFGLTISMYQALSQQE